MLIPAVVKEEFSTEELADPVASAEAAGLRYVTDEMPGIRRKKDGGSFTYVTPDGTKVTDDKTLTRIRSLAIPPAWTDVWICPHPRGHLQATGRDAKGRKQYRYHPRWREVRDAVKFDRLVAFAKALPRIRQRLDRDLARPGLPRAKVLAAMVRLLEETKIRVGNEEYAKQNKSYGLSTLKNRHVQVNGSKVCFRFKGKSGKTHLIELSDRRLARVIQRCLDIPGQELFQYVDEAGEYRDVRSEDVNNYIREIAGDDFTAKDFRTWAGTLLAARFFSECEPCSPEISKREAQQRILRVVEMVADELGNTVAVCRRCYVHPAVFDAFLSGVTLTAGVVNHRQPKTSGRSRYALSAQESALVQLLGENESPPAAKRKKAA
jgi:DNA topoisomerase I